MQLKSKQKKMTNFWGSIWNQMKNGKSSFVVHWSKQKNNLFFYSFFHFDCALTLFFLSLHSAGMLWKWIEFLFFHEKFGTSKRKMEFYLPTSFVAQTELEEPLKMLINCLECFPFQLPIIGRKQMDNIKLDILQTYSSIWECGAFRLKVNFVDLCFPIPCMIKKIFCCKDWWTELIITDDLIPTCKIACYQINESIMLLIGL